MLIGFVGADHKYQFANTTYRDWLGVEPEAMIGRDVFEVVRNGDKHLNIEPRAAGIRRALAGEDVLFQAPWPHLDGRRRDAEVRYLPRLDTTGQVDGFYVFVQDITERVRAEDVLLDAARELERRVAERTAALEIEMAGRAEAEAALRQSQKMEAVGQLTGGIAHDCNNMLTGVLGSLALIRKRVAEGRTDELDRFLDAAQTSAERAAALTQRLLAFSRRQSLHAQPTALSQLVTSMDSLLRQALRENIALRLELPAEPVVAAIDPS